MWSKIWDWIELVLMIVGFIYTVIVIIAFFTAMLPVMILFERTNRIGESNGTNTQDQEAS